METPECGHYPGHADQVFGHITYAQHGEDIFLANLFKILGYRTITWLDLGAHHPTNISNTKYFYDRGGRGVNVEANPALYTAFTIERPLDRNVNLGVGLTSGQANFYMYDDFSGRNTFSFAETARFSAATGGACGGFGITKTIPLPVRTINEIVQDYCFNKFPVLLNCDIEGLDEQVLEQADFTYSRPAVICVETRVQNTKAMNDIMHNKYFEPVIRLGENMIYVHEGHAKILNLHMGIFKAEKAE